MENLDNYCENFTTDAGQSSFYHLNCSGCMKKSNEDRFFHGLLKNVSKKMGGDVSIFDLPKLYNPSIPSYYLDPEIVPLYTYCELDTASTLLSRHPRAKWDGYQENCTLLWNSYIFDSDNVKNPNLIPKDDPFGLCGKRITDKAK